MAATNLDEHFCDLCKVSYSSDNELQDHNWSLMHHIKIEKIKKGAPHSCNLCMESCSNIIEYGKHLNEDRHKLALSRRGKEGTEILDSFSSQSDIFNNDDDTPVSVSNQMFKNQREFQASQRGRQEFHNEGRSINKHSRSFSQPDLYCRGRPYDSNRNSAYIDEYNQQPEHDNNDLFKKPVGRGRHSRTQSDWRLNSSSKHGENHLHQSQGHMSHPHTHQNLLNQHQPNQYEANSHQPNQYFPHPHQSNQYQPPPNQPDQQFHSDNYLGVNWNDNNFFSSENYNSCQWQHSHAPERSRRDRFDSNLFDRSKINTWKNDNQTNYEQNGRDERSRRGFRVDRGHGRDRSYDNNSPESTSSSDSGLKRRLENDERNRSGKSRRRYSPEPISMTSDSSYHGDSRHYREDGTERRSRSRSAGHDRNRSEDRIRSRVESIERPSSRNSDKKVSWSDQHKVSSTSDVFSDNTMTFNDSVSKGSKMRSQLTKSQMLPDSSSESESSFGNTLGLKKGKTAKLRNQKVQGKNFVGDGQTESVLEKAEKLCKKLRNDREKAKQKKQAEEKKKKFEKHQEINKRMDNLKEKSKQNITGVLDAHMSYINVKDTSSDRYKSERRSESPAYSMLSSAGTSSPFDTESAQMIPERLTSTPKPTPSVTSSSSLDSNRSTTPVSSISQRISQTKADIDVIRAKIESSVNKGIPAPMATSTEAIPSPGRHLHVSPDIASPPGRYPQKPERNSLRKMVNSPRTTKERLQLAEMLREHAKSQKKLSLPRFNLKFSDLCDNSDRQDEQVNIDTLAPSIQLEIADIIEADVKPDIAELEKLLDMASAGNCELDANILTNLGVTSPLAKVSSSLNAASPIVIQDSPIRSITKSSDKGKSDVATVVPPKRSFLSENELLCQNDYLTNKSTPAQTNTGDLSNIRKFREWPDLTPPPSNNNDILTGLQESRTWKASDSRPKKTMNDSEASQALTFEDLKTGVDVSRTSKKPNLDDTRMVNTLHTTSERFATSLPVSSVAVSTSKTFSSSTKRDPVVDGDFDVCRDSGFSRDFDAGRDPEAGRDLEVGRDSGVRDFGFSVGRDFGVGLDPSGGRDPSVGRDSGVGQDLIVNIKEEKKDDDYDKAVSAALIKAKSFFNKTPLSFGDGVTLSGSDTPTEENIGLNRDSGLTRDSGVSRDIGVSRDTGLETRGSAYDMLNGGRFSPVRKSIHTQKLYGNDDIPVRDGYRKDTHGHENDDRTTLEKVTSILDGVPAPRVDPGIKSNNNNERTNEDKPSDNVQMKEKHLDSSQHSQSSILDEIYNVSVSEESVRQEITSVDMKISKLKNLIEEASQELNKCSEQKTNLIEQEQTYRTKRLKLLEESRSSSACSQASTNIFSAENLARIQNENPVLLKFLLSQRQSDLSSVGGFSNVETGSQPDTPRNSERRGSITSNVSEPVSLPREQSAPIDTGPINTNTLFSQSIDALSGSSESLVSVFSKQQNEVTEKKPEADAISQNTREATADSKNASNSVTLLKNPLEKVGFVTLDALMRGDTDIGRLLNKSIESIENGTIPEGASPLQKQSSNDSAGTASTLPVKRERHDSTFSLDTGSDSEKKSLSLKYMGTLPEGTNYESLVRQVSMDNKNKSVMFTVFSSPEAMSQLRKNPDAGSNPLKVGEDNAQGQAGYRSDESSKTNSTRTLTHYSDAESQSVKSGYSLGEQIKRICDEHGTEQTMEVDMSRPTDHLTGILFNGVDLSEQKALPVQECSVVLDRVDSPNKLGAKPLALESQSPVRKRLKSKKERDQMSRRKQKENFILQSDTNSEGEMGSNRSTKILVPSPPKSDDDLVVTGSEDRTPRPSSVSEVKKSLLDEVQLETETHSDSCEDSQKHCSIQYKGPALSVASMQEFKGDLYVCYNGSEVRRFDLKTGRILKELDCSPYLVNCLHVTNIEDIGDVLYTAGTCKKLMTFTPEKFNLLSTYDYDVRITCLHEDWGRLFVGLCDGSISVRSMKSDKELNSFSCTTSAIHTIGSTSAGMTKMLCLGTGDKVIYVLDAITGLLITMLEGHTQPPLCLQIFGNKVISGGTDKSMMIHSCTTGDLIKMVVTEQPITHTWCDGGTIYAATCDHIVRTYDYNLKPGSVIKASDKSMITCGIKHNNIIIIGKRDGTVEAIQLDKAIKWSCKFGRCSLQFSIFNQYKLHVMSEHLDKDKSYCSYLNCSHKFTNEEEKQKHVLMHIQSKK